MIELIPLKKDDLKLKRLLLIRGLIGGKYEEKSKKGPGAVWTLEWSEFSDFDLIMSSIRNEEWLTLASLSLELGWFSLAENEDLVDVGDSDMLSVEFWDLQYSLKDNMLF